MKITKEIAVQMVQQYLDYNNSKPNRYIFKNPVYNKIHKRIAATLLIKYWKITGQYSQMLIEEHIDPDNWVDSPIHEIILKEYIEDLKICWSIPFCSKQWYETENDKYGAIGGGPIFVDKDNGEMYLTGSAGIDWVKSFSKYKNGTKTKEWPKWEALDKSKYNITS